MARTKKEIPTIYIYIYYKFRQKAKKFHTYPFLSTAECLESFRRILRLPRKMIYPILREMQDYGFIKKLNHQRFWLNDKKYCVDLIKRIKTYIEYEFW